MTEEQQNEPQAESGASPITQNPAIVALGIVAVVAVLASCIFGYLYLSARDGSIADSDPTPTPFVTAAAVVAEDLIVGVSDSTTITVSVDTPATLTVADRTFPVTAQQLTDGVWQPTFSSEETAVWVYGTIINYVIGLPNTESNRQLLLQMQLGGEMTLMMRDGRRFAFSLSSADFVAVDNREIFAQNMPSLTLVLVDDDGTAAERFVVVGRYVLDESGIAQSNTVSLGESAQLDDVQITVTSATQIPDRAEIPPGFDFFLVDYELQNFGLTAFDTNNLDLVLVDAFGNQYALNRQASQIGNNAPAGGFVNAGQSLQASAGYQIPEGLASPTLNWTVTRIDAGSQLQVTLPFVGSGVAAGAATVSLTRAEVTPDLTGLILAGNITNLSTQPIVVNVGDLALTSAGAVFNLQTTNPPFPWSIPPGETAGFTVTYQRPAAATAVFSVLAQPFQLNGLR